MSSSDVFTAIGTLVALAVAVAGGTLFLIRALRNKKKIGGGDLAIIGFLVLLAIGGGYWCCYHYPEGSTNSNPCPANQPYHKQSEQPDQQWQ
jgi:hypothetical protein